MPMDATQTTLLLISSPHPSWIELRGALHAWPQGRMLADVQRAATAVDLAARRQPTVILVDAAVAGRPLVPLVGDLRATIPASKIIVLGERAGLEHEQLLALWHRGVSGYIVWEGLRAETVLHGMITVLDADVLLGSRVVLEELLAVVERRQGPRVAGLVLSPQERARHTSSVGGHSQPELHATLWEENADLTEILHAVFKRAEIALDVVSTVEAMLIAAAQADPGDFLVIDCSLTLPGDMARCAAIITQTTIPVHIIHPHGDDIMDELKSRARGPVVWLTPELAGLTLLEKLRLLKATQPPAPAEEAVVTRSPLTSRELEVQRLVAVGRTNAQIAARLGITERTVKNHIVNGKHKLGVGTRQEFGTAYQQPRD